MRKLRPNLDHVLVRDAEEEAQPAVAGEGGQEAPACATVAAQAPQRRSGAWGRVQGRGAVSSLGGIGGPQVLARFFTHLVLWLLDNACVG